MKITKRLLRRIVREQRDPSPGYDYDPYSDPDQQWQAEIEQRQHQEYEAWVKETGQVTSAASSVMATYFVEQELTDDKAQIGMMARGYGIDPQDVMRDIKRQQAEYEAGGVLSDDEDFERGFKEGVMKITKRHLKRIIREEKARLIKEARPVHAGQWASAAEAEYPKTADEWVDWLGQIIDQDLTSRGVWYSEEGAAIIEALELLRREIKDEMRGPTR